MKTTYEQARNLVEQAESRVEQASLKLKPFPKLENGLIPDSVKKSPEFQEALTEYRSAFSHLQEVNRWFLRNFNKEYREERERKRKMILMEVASLPVQENPK